MPPKLKLTKRRARAMNAARKTHAAGPGRPRTAPRCPCGAMTVARADQRNHKCAG
jgi:hypothetical protein